MDQFSPKLDPFGWFAIGSPVIFMPSRRHVSDRLLKPLQKRERCAPGHGGPVAKRKEGSLMGIRISPRVYVLGGIAIAALAAVIAAQGNLYAQEEDAGIVVGTYEPQQIAQQTGLQQKIQGEMQGLQQRMQSAQQQGDRQAMQQIQQEAQQIQQRMITEFEDDMDAAMPDVAKETGADIIAAQVSYTADGIETKDVTNEIVAKMGGSAESQGNLVLPQQ